MKNKLLKISLVGKTNAGKSTLINTLVGEKISITNKKINTTEVLISGILNINENQLIFYDTPGISNLHGTKVNNNNFKQNLWEALNNCNIILYVIDSIKINYKEIKKNYLKLSEINKEILIVFNKIDLINKNDLLPITKEISQNLNTYNFFYISAKLQKGINILKKSLAKKTLEKNWIYLENEISNKDDIFISNECTRNEILSQLHKEIPYKLKVQNCIFKYLKNGDLKIKQEIIINNNRYKKIVLGKNGSKIKEIRVNSQKVLSKIFNKNVHLYINIVL